mgnify:CR=1 FL=1
MAYSDIKLDRDERKGVASDASGTALSTALAGATIGAAVGGPAAPVTAAMGALIGAGAGLITGGLVGSLQATSESREGTGSRHSCTTEKTKGRSDSDKQICTRSSAVKRKTKTTVHV